MNKAQIINRYKNLKYYYKYDLSQNRKEIEKIKSSSTKRIERFKKETEVATGLFMGYIISKLPDTYDILINTKGVITKQDAVNLCKVNTSEEIKRNGITFVYIPDIEEYILAVEQINKNI